MNVNIDNLEHVFQTLNGFESLSSGDTTSPDSIYAKTVLKLNGVDFKGREGSESFISSLKAGAKKVYEMIKNFIKAVRDFFFGSKGPKQTKTINDAIKNTQNNSKEIISKKNNNSFDETEISALSAYKTEKERIQKLMNNEKIKLETYNSTTFLLKFSDSIWTAGIAGTRLSEIPGISISDLKSTAARLEDINTAIGFISEKQSAKHNFYTNQERVSIFDTIPPLVELQKLFNEMRTVASNALATVTKDLEHNNELANKQENSDSVELKYAAEKVRRLCNKMVTASNKLTELIKHCDNKIIKINQVMEAVKELTS
ncbi:hypothetical protein [Aeromonas phage AerS_266]|nr:hypothetical protein [Aeromonas phage AerS_266]